MGAMQNPVALEEQNPATYRNSGHSPIITVMLETFCPLVLVNVKLTKK